MGCTEPLPALHCSVSLTDGQPCLCSGCVGRHSVPLIYQHSALSALGVVHMGVFVRCMHMQMGWACVLFGVNLDSTCRVVGMVSVQQVTTVILCAYTGVWLGSQRAVCPPSRLASAEHYHCASSY